jgi:uncharacterized membrane protein YhhN
MGSRNIFLLIFLVLVLLNLWAEYTFSRQLIFLTKPLLITTLGAWFFFETKDNDSLFRKLILLALVFSIGGDTLLMFVEGDPGRPHFFLFGLASFLVAHIFYLTAFVKYPSDKLGIVNRKKWWITIFAVYIAFFNYYLLPDVPKEMQVPVLVYSLAIMTMLIACLNLNGKVPVQTFWILFVGAFLFMISDTIIAINKFKNTDFTIPFARIWIMSLYLLGQYLIVIASAQINSNITIKSQ